MRPGGPCAGSAVLATLLVSLHPVEETSERDNALGDVGEDRTPHQKVLGGKRDDRDHENNPKGQAQPCPEPERDCTVVRLPSGCVMIVLLTKRLSDLRQALRSRRTPRDLTTQSSGASATHACRPCAVLRADRRASTGLEALTP